MMMKKIPAYIAALTLLALVLSGCSNPFIERRPQDSVETVSSDVPEGFGTIELSFSRGAARTLIPTIDLSALYLEYWFSKDGEAPEAKTPVGGKFALEPGDYSLEVKVFVNDPHTELAAQGATSFTVSAGVAATANLTLHPVASGDGTGSLSFSLEYPTGVTVEAFSLIPIAGEGGPLDLTGLGTGAGEDPVTWSGTKTGIPVGYYLLKAALKNSEGISIGRTEVAHIYQNLTATAQYQFTADDFRAYRVTSAADSGPGTLRQAIADANALGGLRAIQILLPPGSVIELAEPLPVVAVGLTIEGNGVTLTRAPSWIAGNLSPQLSIGASVSAATDVTTIRRVHFKNGLATNYGGAAIRHGKGILILESCIFSGNRLTGLTALGGAVYSADTLTIRGCTFFNNTSAGQGGAVYFEAESKNLTLTGNLFYGNRAGAYPVVRNSGTFSWSTPSYNAVDTAFGIGGALAGWSAGTGDTVISGLTVSPVSFKPLSGVGAVGMLPSELPADYPAMDFYGEPISGGGAAGAVQSVIANPGYYLDILVNGVNGVNGSMRGTFSTEPQPDADGFYEGGVPIAITATPLPGYRFSHWEVSGLSNTTANPLTLTLTGHTQARAVFSLVVDNFSDEAGSENTGGTLRYALTNLQDGDSLTFSGVEPGTTAIELTRVLPEITTSVTIEGKGITLTRAPSWLGSDNRSQLLYINNSAANVRIRQAHFKNSLTTGNGGAIYNNGSLTLESCIFSGNGTSGSGGAVYSVDNTLTILGCTFYSNTASTGGAVYFRGASKSLTLRGNLFYGNSAATGPVVYVYHSNAIVSTSYNVADASPLGVIRSGAWSAGTGDATISSGVLPVSPTSFKFLEGSGVAATLPSPLPLGYPTTDFYGDPINASGAAGAVQSAVENTGVYLDLSVNSRMRGSVVPSPAPNADGFYTSGAVVAITASPAASFRHWVVDGVTDDASGNPLTITLSGHTQVQAVFDMVVDTFTDGADSATTPGTLRYALTNLQDNDRIVLSGVEPGTTEIALTSALPWIEKNVIIEGNGVTLTRSSAFGSQDLLTINGAQLTVTIRRAHFKNTLTKNYGRTIVAYGALTLESCIFSGNRTTGTAASNSGPAVYGANTLTIRGCTFYRNFEEGSYGGGAVVFNASGKTLTLTGNLFYGNTAVSGYPALRVAVGNVSASDNAVDIGFGTGSAQAGWNAGSGDTQISGLPIMPASFKLLPGSGALGRLPSPLSDYPTTDFYGDPINANGAAGAAQAVITGAGYYLDISVNDSMRGTVATVPPGTEGFYTSGESVVITASPADSHSFFTHWVVDGVRDTTSGATLTLSSLSAHTQVKAMFGLIVNDFTDGPDSGTTPGTLRYALTKIEDDEVIKFSEVTAGTTSIALASVLPPISKTITIEGNGVTLTRAASWSAANDSQLLRIDNSAAQVTIRRVHFKNGLAARYGGAISTSGILTLESCIFSGNRNTSATSASDAGGAVCSANTLTIRGCTFYNNASTYRGGAVNFSASGKTLTLTGNLFYGNNAPTYPALSPSGTVTASYNMVDCAFGATATGSGWAQGTGDLQISAPQVSPVSFKLLSGSQAAGKLSTLPADYPTEDFYGSSISAGSAIGAAQEVDSNSGYYLDLSVNTSYNNSPRGTVAASPSGTEGFYTSGASVEITASPFAGHEFSHWEVNGVSDTTSGNPLTLASLSAHTLVKAVFLGLVVDTFTDETGSATIGGTLRYALTNFQDDDESITFIGVEPGTTAIELTSVLPAITRNVTIEGKGITLTRASSWTGNTGTSQLLYISNSSANVTIRQAHFKKGAATTAGGAINNMGTLTLESCIFSENTSLSCGAVYSANTLTIRGCTFYLNTGLTGSGAVYFSAAGKTLTLTGNLFYGNSTTVPSGTQRPVAWVAGSGATVSGSYNVVNVAFGTASGQAGWTGGTGDATLDSLSISGVPFDTTTFVPVSGLGSVLPSAPADFPAKDFYDTTRTFPNAPGAVSVEP
jgi:hypothetical protein